jgi:hypothetical protein
MVKRDTIRNFYKKILGYVDTDSVTGVKTVRNFYMKILGTYDPKENKTRDFYKRIIGTGDLTMMLLAQEENSK